MQEYSNITPKQQEILEFIREELHKHNYPPTVREICEAVHLKSTSSVHFHLEAMEKCGLIRRDHTKPRAIEIVGDEAIPEQEEMIRVPIIGRVAAGQPILAEENLEGYYPLPTQLFSKLPNNPLFVLRVHGKSMIKTGIMDGDSIICEQTSTARNGEIVVALVDDSATVKRFYKEKDHIRLQPENDEMEPIVVPDCTILGKVIGLYRMDIR